jgi:hypothetical protein
MIGDGQVHGAVAQGLGAALYEEVIYDAAGQLLTARLADYVIPAATEVPSVSTVHLKTDSPSVGTVPSTKPEQFQGDRQSSKTRNGSHSRAEPEVRIHSAPAESPSLNEN